MSGYQPIGAELLYASYALATTSVPAAAAATITAGMPPIVVPAGYMKNVGSWSSSLRLEIGGQMTTTATIPSWSINLYAAVGTTSPPAFASSGIVLGTTGTFTPTTAATSVNFLWEMHIGLRALALGAASTIVGWGYFQCTSVNAAGLVTFPPTGAYAPPATWDASQAYVLWPGLTLGAATAGNTVTVQYAKLYGES